MCFLHLLMLNKLNSKNNIINSLIYSSLSQLFFAYQLIISASSSSLFLNQLLFLTFCSHFQALAIPSSKVDCVFQPRILFAFSVLA